MKRFLVITILCIVSFSSYAQEHLKIKGVPIDGSLSSFTTKLKNAGLIENIRLSEATKQPVLTGEFAGISDCNFTFLTTADGTVCKVLVITSHFTGWLNCKAKYKDMVELYSSKYNLVSKSDSFQSPYYDGDGYELSAIRQGKGQFMSIFNCDEGYISVTLDASDSSEGYLTIIYEDTTNSEIYHSEREKKRSDDI